MAAPKEGIAMSDLRSSVQPDGRVVASQTVDVVCAVISDGRASMTGDSETAAAPPPTTSAQHVSVVICAQTLGFMYYASAWWFSMAHLV